MPSFSNDESGTKIDGRGAYLSLPRPRNAVRKVSVLGGWVRIVETENLLVIPANTLSDRKLIQARSCTNGSD